MSWSKKCFIAICRDVLLQLIRFILFVYFYFWCAELSNCSYFFRLYLFFYLSFFLLFFVSFSVVFVVVVVVVCCLFVVASFFFFGGGGCNVSDRKANFHLCIYYKQVLLYLYLQSSKIL